MAAWHCEGMKRPCPVHFYSLIYFILLGHAAWQTHRISVPRTGIKLMPPYTGSAVSTTGPPGKSLSTIPYTKHCLTNLQRFTSKNLGRLWQKGWDKKKKKCVRNDKQSIYGLDNCPEEIRNYRRERKGGIRSEDAATTAGMARRPERHGNPQGRWLETHVSSSRNGKIATAHILQPPWRKYFFKKMYLQFKKGFLENFLEALHSSVIMCSDTTHGFYR